MRIIAGLLLVVASVMPCAGRTASEFFAQAPAEAVPLLTAHDRLDMLDYYHSGVETATGNTLNGKARLTSESPMKVTAQVTGVSDLQVAVLPAKGDTIVAFIETVASPVKDSAISFYRASDWRRMPDAALPTMADFIPAKNRDAVAVTEMPSLFFVGIDYDPEQELFLIYNNSFDNLPEGERPDAAKLMDSVQAYRYDGRKLVRVKEFREKVETQPSTAGRQ